MGKLRIISIVGKSKSGKTTLLEKLIPELKRRGYRVGTIKHHKHSEFEVDKPGKDTWRHARAGAHGVALVAPGKMFLVRETEGEIPLEEVAAMMGPVDILLTEGFRWAATPKIEIVRNTDGEPPLCSPTEVLAFVTDQPPGGDALCIGLDEVEKVADLIESKFLTPG